MIRPWSGCLGHVFCTYWSLIGLHDSSAHLLLLVLCCSFVSFPLIFLLRLVFRLSPPAPLPFVDCWKSEILSSRLHCRVVRGQEEKAMTHYFVFRWCSCARMW